MTIKQLMHKVVAFCNNFIDNNHILVEIDKYPSGAINADISVWEVDNNNRIESCKGRVAKYIHNENDFHNFIDKTTNELPELLEQVK